LIDIEVAIEVEVDIAIEFPPTFRFFTKIKAKVTIYKSAEHGRPA
jgi:hypothetical protein